MKVNFDELVWGIPVAACVLSGRDYVIEAINKKLSTLLGNIDKYLYQPFFNAFPHLQNSDLKLKLDEAYSSGNNVTARSFPMHFTPQCSEHIVADVSLDPIRNNSTTGAIIMKLTEIAKDTEIPLQAKPELIHPGLAHLIWQAGQNGEGIFFNKTFCEYVGAPVNELVGESWVNYIHPEDRVDTQNKWAALIESGSVIDIEHRLRRNDGTYRWFVTRGRPLKDEHHRVCKWSITTTDIHTRKEAEIELEDKVKERTKDLQSQKSFINSILDASLSGIVALDAIKDDEGNVIDFSILKINKKFKSIIGLDDSVIGESYLKYFPFSTKNGIFDMYVRILKTGHPETIEVYSLNQGINSWIKISAAKREDNGVVASFEDITSQRENSVRLQNHRNLLDNILKHIPAGINVFKAIRGSDGNVIDMQCILSNEAASAFGGITSSELTQQSVLKLKPELAASELFNMAVRTLQTGEPFRKEYFSSRVQRWLELSVVKMNEDHLINVFRDITPIKEGQIKLEEAAERLTSVFNASLSGMFTFTPVFDDHKEIIDFRFGITNPTLANYVGQRPKALQGGLGSKWFPGYLRSNIFEMYKRTFNTGETLRTELQYNAGHQDFHLDVQSTKVGDEVLVTFNDFTAIKKTQIQLQKSVDDLKRSNANLEEFAYAASHDLKEPIRKIGFFSDALKQTLTGALNEEQEKYFERLKFATRRMHTLIDDLLTYSSVRKDAAFIEEVSLKAMVDLVLEDLEVEISQKQATITIEELPVIKGHRRQLQQLFQNIISNALKYVERDKEPIIHIGTEHPSADVHPLLSGDGSGRKFYLIKITDNGFGFEQKDSQRIFNVFTRLHGNEIYRGTGIGLSIVQKIVDSHDGAIWADSVPQQGTTFNILLPA